MDGELNGRSWGAGPEPDGGGDPLTRRSIMTRALSAGGSHVRGAVELASCRVAVIRPRWVTRRRGLKVGRHIFTVGRQPYSVLFCLLYWDVMCCVMLLVYVI
jgi:hypothetical protein